MYQSTIYLRGEEFQAVGLHVVAAVAAVRMASSRANPGTCAVAARGGISYQPTS